MVPDVEPELVLDPLPVAEVLLPVLLAPLALLALLPVPVEVVESVLGLVPSRWVSASSHEQVEDNDH
jgi:hypothetical protein